jgi:peptidoglycan/xylan/chitin deacetylase (PgdA/CDA1 family)
VTAGDNWIVLAGLCVFVSAGIVVYVGIPFIYGRVAKKHLYRTAFRKKALAITFDDGPGDKLTLGVLKLLDERNVKATFFLLGRNIPGREAIVRLIAEKEHEICSHGYDHINYLYVSPFRALADIRHGWEAIDAALGKSKGIYPFRPPYGKLNIVCLLYLLIRRVPIIYWSLDAGDTRRSGEFDADQAAQLVRRQGGGVLLLHDFDRSDERVNGNVIECLSQVLAVAEAEGIRLIRVSELLSL